MKTKFTTFTVYATVVLSSLAILPLTVSGVMMESGSSGHEKPVTWFNNSERQHAYEKSVAAAIKGMRFFFSTVTNELTKCNHGKNNIETGHIGTIDAWLVLYNIIFSQIPKNHPLASPENRKGAYSAMEKAVSAVYKGITVSISNRSTAVLSELQTLQKTAACGLRKAAIRIYAYLLGQNDNTEIGAVVFHYRRATISAAVSAIREMIDAIRILAAITSGTKAGSKDDLSSITAVIEENANTHSVNWIKNIFYTIDVLFPVCHKKEV